MWKKLIWVFLMIELCIYIMQLADLEIYIKNKDGFDIIFWISLAGLLLSYILNKKYGRN